MKTKMIQEFMKKYKVLLILFVYLIVMSYAFTQSTHNSFMLNLMGLFFVIFSFFKIIHLKEFKASFSKYDLIAKKIKLYGLIYPFIELSLGVLFILGLYIQISSIVTIIILTSTTIGVVSKLRKGKIIECACLGVVFNLPLSQVTVFENVVMILMALITLL